MKRILRQGAFFISLMAARVYASDIEEAIPTGGLSLADSHGLVMDAEHFTVTPFHIHAEYVLRNPGGNNFNREAAFRLPVFDTAPLEGEKALDGADVNNPLALVVTVDGKAQPVRTDRQHPAHADGMISPVQVTRTWMQSFPAGRAVTIVLDYTTAPGLNAIYPVSAGTARDVCMSDGMRRTMSERTDENHFQVDVRLSLPVSALPPDPVGRFTLTLDKAAPTDLLSLCIPGELKKVSPTHFVAEREHFTPPEAIRILFLAAPMAAAGNDMPADSTPLTRGQARDRVLAALRRKPLSSIPVECMDFMDSDTKDNTHASSWVFDVYERHDATCGGDPATSTRLFSVHVDKQGGALSTDNDDRDLDFHPM